MLILLNAFTVFAQRSSTVTVLDSLTREPLSGATVTLGETGQVLVTDDRGTIILPSSESRALIVRLDRKSTRLNSSH